MKFYTNVPWRKQAIAVRRDSWLIVTLYSTVVATITLLEGLSKGHAWYSMLFVGLWVAVCAAWNAWGLFEIPAAIRTIGAVQIQDDREARKETTDE